MSTPDDLSVRVEPAYTAAIAAMDAHEAALRATASTALARLSAQSYDDAVLAEHLAHGGIVDGLEIAYAGTGRPALETFVAYVEGEWLIWDGRVWARKREPDAVEIVRQELRAIFTHDTADPNLKAESVKRAVVLLQKQKAANVLYFLRGLLAADSSTFDAHPDLLNVQNGIVDLRTGTLRDHDPRYRFTKFSDVDFSLTARSDDWSAALEAVPEDVREWLQERYGQAATGHMAPDDLLVIQQGGGSNGKSTLENGIKSALGDYAGLIPEKALTGNSSDHPTDQMTLRGLRLAVVEELPEGKHLPTKRLKDLVGTQQITARPMRGDFVTFDATHSLFVNSNYVPQVAETDHGTWRRLALVRFPYRFVGPGERVLSIHDRPGDPGLRERLKSPENRQAVLAWLVRGAMHWYGRDRTFMDMPASVVADTRAWREDADLILAYANARLVFDPAGAALSKEVYEDFSCWLTDNGRQSWTDATFSARLGAHELAEKNGVKKEKRRTQSLTLSHRFGPNLTAVVPAQANVWSGLRFRMVADDA